MMLSVTVISVTGEFIRHPAKKKQTIFEESAGGKDGRITRKLVNL